MTELTKILYVDDEDDIREVAEIALELNEGVAVKLGASGHEALKIAADWQPDLILLDVMMPGMDGPTTLQNLRQLPTCVDIPVIFITARTQPSDMDHFMQLGAAGVISKPFDPMALASQAMAILARVSTPAS